MAAFQIVEAEAVNFPKLGAEAEAEAEAAKKITASRHC